MPHYENDAPFEIPESWEWTTIGDIASSILYGVSESAKETGQYRLLRITDIQENNVNWSVVHLRILIITRLLLIYLTMVIFFLHALEQLWESPISLKDYQNNQFMLLILFEFRHQT